ncbi:hypothetical protein H2198_007695 [Neophaeococcomyces mojaviensis]|uniref:Uncharacterized protein n=1 Tax=Neophaeococcomyces mojaviensis TaxID=3383035 RepID=A0ACC2ZZC8_9EURO|nr:hypothetical protein H2198_007695 [Knufia sp. JES_112]
MSSKFRAWLHVTPCPRTLAESSAIFKHLKSQGRVSAFIRATQTATGSESPSNGGSTTYYTIFSHEPPHLRTSYNVPVYHDVSNPRDEDPYNIRGLQDRKPFPPPRIFTCTLESVDQNTALLDEKICLNNPYHGPFRVEKNDWFQEVLGEIGAPAGLQQGLGIVGEGTTAEDIHGERAKRKTGRQRRIRMDSLMEPWHEAVGLEPPRVRAVVRDPKAVVRKVEIEKTVSAGTVGKAENITKTDPDIPLGQRIDKKNA